MSQHPNQIHIDAIREALWRGPQYGKAAILIGAGMSQNAVAKEATVGRFPNWAQLMLPMLEDLYAKYEDARKKAERAALANAVSEALRIASEYVAIYGEAKLEALLKKAVPDDSYDPSDLHIRLMKLRWADVFTTNWDTLLEKAADRLPFKRYAVIRNIGEIPVSRHPRITKLHGSFPSNSPFILTEEHFRCYPRDYAPFVNMVQQSIVENTLCLIGFSGNDPNFLQWTGWVRDNLREHSNFIYLVTLTPLRLAQERLLFKRRVHVIDLSNVFDEGVPDKYAKTLEWFLINLEAGCPPTPGAWPKLVIHPPDAPVRDLSQRKFDIYDCNGKQVEL